MRIGQQTTLKRIQNTESAMPKKIMPTIINMKTDDIGRLIGTMFFCLKNAKKVAPSYKGKKENQRH